jgi:hypothetical protein
VGAVLTHQTSLLGCVGPGPKVVAPIGPVVEQAQCDLGGPRLVAGLRTMTSGIRGLEPRTISMGHVMERAGNKSSESHGLM